MALVKSFPCFLQLAYRKAVQTRQPCLVGLQLDIYCKSKEPVHYGLALGVNRKGAAKINLVGDEAFAHGHRGVVIGYDLCLAESWAGGNDSQS